MSAARPNTPPSPPTAPVDMPFDVSHSFNAAAAVVLMEGEVVNVLVAMIVQLYVIVAVAVAVGKIAVPAARKTVPLPDVQQSLAAAS